MFQLPIPIFDAEHSKGSAELGQLPDWNLNDLYTSTDAKELVTAMDGLFAADEMSQMPFTVFIFDLEFSSSTNNFTHQICFLAPCQEFQISWSRQNF